MSSETKVWFITGCSSGLGLNMTRRILQNGEKVVATSRKTEILSELAAKYPETILVLRLDVTKPTEVAAAFAAAQEKFGRIDVVMNNAGVGLVGEVESTSERIARDTLEVNFWGASHVTKEAVRFFREVNKPMGGRLLQVTATGGILSKASVAYYCASKFALEALSEGIATELHPDWNIKITILEPGPFRANVFGAPVTTAIHPAYTDPSMSTMRGRKFFSDPDLRIIASLDKIGDLVYRVGYLEDPPLRLPVHPMAVALLRRKGKLLLDTAETWESWSEDLLEV